MPNYASPWGGYDSFGRMMLESTPESAYSKWMGAQGGGVGSPMASYGRGLYPQFQNDYFATAAESGNQGLSWLDYLDRLGMGGRGVSDIWSGLSPSQRGDKNAGRARYVGF